MNRIVLRAAAPTVMNAKPMVALADAAMEPLEGWAAKYGVVIERWFGNVELAAGLFADSLGKPEEIRILSQHDSGSPIGLARSFTDSADGLYMNAEVNTETQAGREVMSNVRAGILAAFSVGFNTLESEMVAVGKGRNAEMKEVITRAELVEVSVVTFPAISDAKIQQQAIPVDAELSEDERHPGARAVLERIIAGGKVRV